MKSTRKLNLTAKLKLEEDLKKHFDSNLKDKISITLNELEISSFVIEEIKEMEVDFEIL